MIGSSILLLFCKRPGNTGRFFFGQGPKLNGSHPACARQLLGMIPKISPNASPAGSVPLDPGADLGCHASPLPGPKQMSDPMPPGATWRARLPADAILLLTVFDRLPDLGTVGADFRDVHGVAQNRKRVKITRYLRSQLVVQFPHTLRLISIVIVSLPPGRTGDVPGDVEVPFTGQFEVSGPAHHSTAFW